MKTLICVVLSLVFAIPLLMWEAVAGFAEDYGWGKTILGILIFIALASSIGSGGEDIQFEPRGRW